jgi:hypothetical protein
MVWSIGRSTDQDRPLGHRRGDLGSQDHHARRSPNVDQKALGVAVVCGPSRAAGQSYVCAYSVYGTSNWIEKTCGILLDVGHQQVLVNWIPGQPIGSRANTQLFHHRACARLNGQHFARAAGCREHQIGLLRADHPTPFWTARDRCEVGERLAIEDLDGI